MNESVQRLESKYAEARSEESMDIDLNDSVQRLEAKCAGVREELGRMALSEQYMRTKQAQLRARKKELEAKEATITKYRTIILFMFSNLLMVFFDTGSDALAAAGHFQ